MDGRWTYSCLGESRPWLRTGFVRRHSARTLRWQFYVVGSMLACMVALVLERLLTSTLFCALARRHMLASAAWDAKRRNLPPRRVGLCGGQPVAALLKRRPKLQAAAARYRSPPLPVAKLPRWRGVCRLRGFQSGKYLRCASDGQLVHDDFPHNEHLFVLFPGTGMLTGLVRLHHLATDSSVVAGQDGSLGCFQGEFASTFWYLSCVDGERFTLQSCVSGMRLFSNVDGRLGQYSGEDYDDQFFIREDRDGHVMPLSFVRTSLGLQDSGFQWLAGLDRTVYTDSFHAGRYIFNNDLSQLLEVKDPPPKPPPPDSPKAAAAGGTVVTAALAGSLDWGTASDLQLPSMQDPHGWAIDHIPLLQRLRASGLISATDPLNAVFEAADFQGVMYDGEALLPSSAIRFALKPVSAGRRVPFEPTWHRAWHGTSLRHIEGIARRGLQPGQKGNIFLSPSFQYVFCLYSVPDLCVRAARFRLVVEVRVRPGSYREHGDHYGFFSVPEVEKCIPEDRVEWEQGDDAESVQVVGLILKQLRPDHPAVRHDTNVRHACGSLINL